MRTQVVHQAFDPWQELAKHHQNQEAGRSGACCNFVGMVRDYSENPEVQTLTLQHYPGMTETFLQRIASEAMARWPISDALILHRVGRMQLNDCIVLTAVWSAHRAEAFEANRYLIEELKHRAPFWKKESTPSGEYWVKSNTPRV